MQQVSRLNKINFRIFRSFAWPAGLDEFARFNLIYGWNASGKTTLSSLFRNIEKRQPLVAGTAEFAIGGKACDLKTISSADALPIVRVFNREFVDANVLTSQLAPIFYLGAESIEKQKRVEELKAELSANLGQQQGEETKLASARAALESCCIEHAKLIKELLSSSGGGNPYNNYNKSHFKDACEDMRKSGNAKDALLDNETKSRLKRQKEGLPKPALAFVSLPSLDLQLLAERVNALLERTVVSHVISELVASPTLGAWVQQGLLLHSGRNARETCGFCGQPLPEARLRELEAHFNDTYNQLLKSLKDFAVEIRSLQDALRSVPVPESSAVYDHLADKYWKAVAEFGEHKQKVMQYLSALIVSLESKKERVFEQVSVDFSATETSTEDLTKALAGINDAITLHNEHTKNFAASISAAREQLEKAHIAETLDEITTKEQNVHGIAGALGGLKTAAAKINGDIGTIETEIVEHRQPAEELNAELASYLGRNDLRLKVSNTGYVLAREDAPAANLSDGEKTAFAFLYFLKSLQDKSVSLPACVVVIDDPISSLDTNSLFSAFAFMKERTKSAGQLFVLTHNFSFFSQVKNWYNHLPNQKKKNPTLRPAHFYMLQQQFLGDKRAALIAPLDELLHKYESEYQYLFKRIYEEAHRTGAASALEEYYCLPNIARRLIEGFLAFRYPGLCGFLQQQFDEVNYDSAKKARILRFLHTHSHDGQIPEHEHDLSVLSETPQILKELLELIATEDKRHFAEMEKTVCVSFESEAVVVGAAAAGA